MRKSWIAATAVAAVLATTPPAVAAVRVKVVDNAFKPKVVQVAKGTRVVWVNNGEDAHTTTSKKGLWDATLQPGEAFRFRFRKAGTFRYFGQFHDGMTGRIVVG